MVSAAVTKKVCSFCLRGTHSKCSLPESCTCPECYPPVQEPGQIVWEDPKVQGQGPRGKPPLTEEQVEQLRAHPNVWGRVLTFNDKKKAGSVKGSKARKEQCPDGEFEFAARSRGSSSMLYAKFVPIADRKQPKVGDKK